MALNMKTYKGYNKRPYCNAHYPTTSFTVVTDTPENLRLKQQTVKQSTILYKQEFEKSKGKGTTVVDTPEFDRLRKTQNQISPSNYANAGDKSKTMPSPQIYHDMPSSAPQQSYQPQERARGAEPAPAAAPIPTPPISVKRYRAIYDYSAADDDEVSFMDGDVIVDVQQIDEGWMFGRVERTGLSGMLPANYVENI